MSASDDFSPNLSDPGSWLDRYGDYLFRFALARVGETQVAEDLVQETLLAALKGKDSFSGKSSERTWLTGILKHKVLDYLRKSARESSNERALELPIEQQQQFWHGDWTLKFAPREWGRDPAEVLRSKSFWTAFENCLKALPKHYRIIFTLHEMEEISTDAICKDLEITATNLWVIMHRTRRQLRRCLEVSWTETGKNE